MGMPMPSVTLSSRSVGNATIIARVITLEDTHGQAKAGVMIRAGIDAEVAERLYRG